MARKPKPAPSRKSPPDRGSVKVRMYRQGLGDCFLVRIPRQDGTTFSLMIDCGVIVGTSGPEDKMKAVVSDIIGTTGGFVDVLAVTHEHWDHVSGFEQAKELFNPGGRKREEGRLSFGEVWFAWTEDPRNPVAKQIREERERQLRGLHAAVSALGTAAQALGAADDADSPGAQVRRSGEEIAGVLGFFGLEDGAFGAAADAGKKTAAAMRAARNLVPPERVRYLRPGKEPWTSADLPGLRIFTLGPPEDPAALRRTDARGETYHSLAAGPAADAFFSAGALLADGTKREADDSLEPFDATVAASPLAPLAKAVTEREPASQTSRPTADEFFVENYFASRATETTRFDPLSEMAEPAEWRKADDARMGTVFQDQSWRRIDADWLGMAPELALQLDGATNNTSLVLAVELSEGGPVLLFVADAQAGNWLSWDELSWKIGRRTVTAADLMARAVFYKCGHHGSHNASMKGKGIERMTSGDLIAFVPVDRPMARRKRWNQMPLEAILDVLHEHAGGRVALSELPNDKFPPQDFSAFGDRLAMDPGESLYLEASFPLR